MWLFLPDAFVALTKHPSRSGHILVRSNSRDDLLALLPDAEVVRSLDVNGWHECAVRTSDAAEHIKARVMSITYPSSLALESERAQCLRALQEMIQRYS